MGKHFLLTLAFSAHYSILSIVICARRQFHLLLDRESIRITVFLRICARAGNRLGNKLQEKGVLAIFGLTACPGRYELEPFHITSLNTLFCYAMSDWPIHASSATNSLS